MLLLLGLAAGVLTTVAGMGGGMALVLVLSILWGAPMALAVTAPALLFGNVHRAYLFRGNIDRRIAYRFALGAVPGAIFGGLAAASLPPLFLNVTMLFITGYAIARAMGWVRFTPPPSSIFPAGLIIGVLAATSGGAAVLTAPVLMAAGLAGDAYIATVALASVALHTGRILGYGAAGLIDPHTLELSVVLGAAIFGGNLLGQRLRKMVPEHFGRVLEVATLGACTVLAVVGVT